MNYADDLVILCKRGKAEEALLRMREIMGQLKLTVNEEKTRVARYRMRRSIFWVLRLGGCIRCARDRPSGLPAVEAQYPAHGEKDPCADRRGDGMARDHSIGEPVEPHVAGLGKLLSGRECQPCIPCARQLHDDAVAPVVT